MMPIDVQDKEDIAALAHSMVEALRDARIDDAERSWHQLLAVHPPAEDMLIFPVMIAIQRGQVQDALHHIEALPEDRGAHMKALCLYLLRDPSWHAHATALEDSPNPMLRKAMRQLLGKSADFAD